MVSIQTALGGYIINYPIGSVEVATTLEDVFKKLLLHFEGHTGNSKYVTISIIREKESPEARLRKIEIEFYNRVKAALMNELTQQEMTDLVELSQESTQNITRIRRVVDEIQEDSDGG